MKSEANIFVILGFSWLFLLHCTLAIEEFIFESNDYSPTELEDDSNYNETDQLKDEEIAIRIISGELSEKNQFPYQAGIVLRQPKKRVWCGASVLSENFVITAAHCVDDALSGIVIFGAHNRENGFEEGRVHKNVSRSDFIIHELWNRKTLEADIALVRVEIAYTDYIQPIVLPFGDYAGKFFDNEEGIVSGWGKYKADCKKLSTYLRHYQGRIMHNRECYQFYKQAGVNHICVDGRDRRQACEGDSGGPLAVTVDNGVPMLVGITSFGRCCGSKFPTAFTRITQYLNWILLHTDMN